MIIYRCIKYESNALIFSKDVELKPFFNRTDEWAYVRSAIILYLPPPLIENKPASVAQLDALSDWRPGGRGFNPPPRSATFFRGD